MTLITRSIHFQTPSSKPLASKKAIITQKCKFFDVLAYGSDIKSLYRILKDCDINKKTGRR